MAELKPCLDCKAVPICVSEGGDFRIECECPHRGWNKNLDHAIELWNSRPPSPVEDKLRSVLAEAYRFAGAYNAPNNVLDALSDAANGKPGSRSSR